MTGMLVTAFFLALVAKTLVEGVATPLKAQFPKVNFWWLIYATWVLGGALSFLSGINLFVAIIPTMPPLAGQILTALVVGGGSNIIHDIMDNVNAPVAAR